MKLRPTLSFAALAFSLAVPLLAKAQQPPIIDRALFFGEVQIGSAQISPDGKYLSFLKPFKGTRNLWVKKVDEPFSAARPVSAEAVRPVRGYFWSRDAHYLLYSQDAGGDENFNVYAIDPAQPADPRTGVPPTRALTNLKGVRTELVAAPKSKPDILYIGLNDRDPKWHDLYELHISTGEKTLLRKNTDQISGWEFDHAGNLRLAARTTQAGDTEILRVDPGGFAPVYSCSVLESCGLNGFLAGNQQAYMVTNKGALDLIELDVLDPATGTLTKMESDPEKRVDLEDLEISEVDYRPLFTSYQDKYLVAPDEGHGFARPINNLAMVTAMEQFFSHYLQGRVQPDVPADVQARLQVLTVDPKTVDGSVKLNGPSAEAAK